MKTALVHDFLFEYAGSERVLEQILTLYPEADLFSLVDYLPKGGRGFIRNKPVQTTFLQRLPAIRRSPARLLPFVVPLMPLAIEQLDLSGYDLVISSSHSVAKGVITGPDQLHISYVHSPMRYAWDLQGAYLKHSGIGKGPLGGLARLGLAALRMWDVRTANGVDIFLANSGFVARRIWKTYRRQAEVIYPPVNVGEFPLSVQKDDYYLVVSRLVPYKRIDLIVEAFRRMPGRQLVVIGTGPELNRLRRQAAPNIHLLGYQPGAVVRRSMQRARAFIAAAEEDFGIAAVEAQACGTPVIAYGHGGLAETVRGIGSERPTGVHFFEQDVASLNEAIGYFERLKTEITPENCRANALQFTPESFRAEFNAVVQAESCLHKEMLKSPGSHPAIRERFHGG